MFVDFNILNQLGSPSINSNTFANRPAAGQTGRLFVSTDTYEIYRDNGTTWDLIGGPGSSTVTGTGAATQVAYWTAAQAIGGSNNLWWDNTNGFLGVGTAAPTTRIEAVKTDGIGIYANFTTNAGSGSGTTAIWAKNVTNSSGFAAVIEETTPNATAGQYPLLIKHSLSSGTAGVGMGTGVHWQLPDDAGTFKTTQLTIETIDAAAATYKTRYRFNVQNNGSSTPVAYINSTGVGVFTATPSAALDIHSTGVIAVLNSTGSTNNGYLAFQRAGAGVWRIGDTYNGGLNQFEIHNTVLGIDAVNIKAATNKTSWQATESYTSGVARGNYFDYNLTLNPASPLASPNVITALGASLDLTLQGSITIPSGARSGLDAYNSISFTTTGTLTHNQGTQIRAYSNVTAGWAFGGSATGTITHLAGLRALFPDNSGSAVTVTNNYALLLNDQTANTGTVTYTNRWGVYQEGASDLNYFAANTLIGTTTNTGNYKLQVNGDAYIVEFLRFSANTKGIIIGTNGAVNPYIQGGSGNQLFLGTNNNPRITILSTGEVGIGTTTPLAVANYIGLTTSGTNGSFVSLYTGATQIGRIEVNSTTDFTIKSIANVPMILGTNNTERARFTSAGVLQVGTSASTNLTGGSVLANSVVAAQGFLPSHQTSVGVLEYNSNKTSIRSYGATAGSGFLTFNVGGGGGSADAEAVRIATNGNFLIGTTTDTGEKLQVNGTLTAAGEITTGTVKRAFLLQTLSGDAELGCKSGGTTSIFSNGSVALLLSSTQTATFSSSIRTSAPSGGSAASWKLGTRQAATVALDTTQYIELDVNGTLYKLAIVT